MGVKSNGIIEISVPNNLKNVTNNDISVIFFEFWCDGGPRVTLGQATPKSIPITIYLSSFQNFGVKLTSNIDLNLCFPRHI